MMVSVVIPVYNVEAYLERCVNSVLAQTLCDYEVILVDDGSTDSSGLLCDKLAEKNPDRITVVHKKNGGLSDARNHGVKHSNGEYITFIDSDDYVGREYLRLLYEAAVQNDAEVSCCGYVRTKESDIAFDDERDYRVVTGIEACREMLTSTDFYLVTAWAKLIRRELVIQDPFPVGRLHEDVATTYKYYLSSKKVVMLDTKQYAYYINESGIQLGRITEKRKEDILYAYFNRARDIEKRDEPNLSGPAWNAAAMQLMQILISEPKDPGKWISYYIEIKNKRISQTLKGKLFMLMRLHRFALMLITAKSFKKVGKL